MSMQTHVGDPRVPPSHPTGRSALPGRLVAGRAAHRVSLALALAALVAAGGSLLFPDLLHGQAVTDGNLRGTALVVVAVAVPVLVAGTVLSARGSVRGLVAWLGAAVYLTYQGVMFCFGTPMNELFLPYVAMLGLGVWTLVLVMVATDRDQVAGCVGEAMPYVAVSAGLGVFATLNGLAWLARTAPAAFSGDPAGPVDGTGLLTSPVFVQDLAVWIPVALVAAWLTWSRYAGGVLVALSMLAFYVLECLSVASDQWWGARADDSRPELASLTAVPAALAAAVVTAGILVWAGRHLASRREDRR